MPGLMKKTAQDTLAVIEDFRDGGQFEQMASLAIDCVDAFKLLLRDGSPLLQRSLVSIALEHAPAQVAT